MVKELYSNLITNNKRHEVMVTRNCVSYSEDTINMIFGLKPPNDLYQYILDRASEKDNEVYLQSLCNPSTTWVEAVGETIVKRIDLKPEVKAWYQFIKHLGKPSTHNETVNKSRLALLHCIIVGEDANVGKIAVQEI